jgi:GYF domain 2
MVSILMTDGTEAGDTGDARRARQTWAPRRSEEGMMADAMATGWYFLKSGAVAGQQVGPLTWEQVHAARSSGSLQPSDLVWHPTMPQWSPAAQIQGLFPAAVQPAPYQPAPYQPMPYQPAPYQPMSYQQAPYQAMGQPAWAGQAPYRKRSSVAAWLIPLIALVLAGGGLGAYFGFFYHKGEAVSASDLVGLWEGTLTYQSLEFADATEEELAYLDSVLGAEIPATLDLTLDEETGGTAQPAGVATADQKRAGAGAVPARAMAEGKEVSGTATLTMDVSVVDESAGTVTDTMLFTYSGNTLTFEAEDPIEGTQTVTAVVSRDGDVLSMKGTMTFDDGESSGKAVWSVSKESPKTDSTEDDGEHGDNGGDEETEVTEGDGGGAFVPADLNGTWDGTLTITSSSGDPWAARGLTADLLGGITGIPIPVTMDIAADDTGNGSGQMVVSATSLGAAFDIGTADMPLTTSGTTLTFQPESWPWGVPTMIGEVAEDGGVLVIDGTFSYVDASSSFDAVFRLAK